MQNQDTALTGPSARPTNKAPLVYCTLFDSGYLSRGLALFKSLRSHGDTSPIFVLALDAAVEEYLRAQTEFDGIYTFTLADLEVANPRLLEVKSARTRMEYVFTCTPLLLRYVADLAVDHDGLCVYLDSDLYYFDDPSEALADVEGASIGLTPHRYSPRLRERLQKYGTFNAGWIAIRNDKRGLEALNWYGEKTLEWCHDTPDQGRYADQGYLDQLVELPGAVSISSPGVNLAPWNTADAKISSRADGVFVNGDPLVFFHFHGMRRLGGFFVTSQLIYGSSMTRALRQLVYRTYVDVLAHYEDEVRRYFGRSQSIRRRGHGVRGLLGRLRKSAINVISVVTGNALRAVSR